MRFRAKVVDIGCIEQFTRVVSTVSKMTPLCILRLTVNKMYFILNDKVAKGGIWCELTASNFFDEYRMEGLSEEANEIYLEITPEDVVRAMKTAQTAKSVKVKLTKKFSPCLTFDIELPSRTGHSRNVVHDVPVNVIPKSLWSEYSEPTVPDFDVSICMPPLKALRNVVERMKNLGSYMELSANQNGEMRLRVETDQVTVSTHFKDLEIPEWVNEGSESQTQGRQPDEMVGARVDIRRFLQFLTGQQLNPPKIICNIVDNRLIHFFLLQEDISMQYSMPIIHQ
ncbi:checkpoint protein HUS1-like [Acanthaster planci]|uniref:Checkpoint protein n=1 Tax=Acanthaster planci TaxID=133434 RepID=A0A8B7Y1N6_ACAPL|nr:checkpoint protein HUS1-like [Acanthaster planci]